MKNIELISLKFCQTLLFVIFLSSCNNSFHPSKKSSEDLSSKSHLLFHSASENEIQLFVYPGEFSLQSGQKIGDDHMFLIMQTDGNLVLYVNYFPVWNSQTWGQCPNGCTVTYRNDGEWIISNGIKIIQSMGWVGSKGVGISDIYPYFLLKFNDTNPYSDLTQKRNGDPMTSLGFNETFITGYGLYNGYKCPEWNGTTINQCNNYLPVSLPTIRGYLDALVKMNIKVHREIVSVLFYNDPNNFNYIVTVLKEFQKRNMTLILANGFPIETQYTHNHILCLPRDQKKFQDLAYNIAGYTENLFKRLRQSNQLDESWLQNNIKIEPWNEFDATTGELENGECDSGSNYSYGSPQKAAVLQQVMAYVFYLSGFSNEIIMPSIINTFSGKLSSDPTSLEDKYAIYLNDYYAAGGKGRPNLHIYPVSTDSESNAINVIPNVLARARLKVPNHLQNHFIVSETGLPLHSSSCTIGVNEDKRDRVYQGQITHPLINSSTDMLIYWRLARFNSIAPDGSQLGCESQLGVVREDKMKSPPKYWSDFDATALKMFYSHSKFYRDSF